ncbi:DUF4136 domain-containing protein, partial [Kaarinaea lacus]
VTMLRQAYFILLVLLLYACAGDRANVDYDATANFTAYKTYAWSEKTDEATTKSQAAEPLLHKRIHDTINATLKAKGFQLVDKSHADILISYHLSVAATGYSGSSVHFGVGSFGHSSGVGLSVGVPVSGQVVEEGKLVINIIDARKDTVVWQGSSSRELSRSPTPEKTQQMVDEIVNEILTNYPPKK